MLVLLYFLYSLISIPTKQSSPVLTNVLDRVLYNKQLPAAEVRGYHSILCLLFKALLKYRLFQVPPREVFYCITIKRCK